MPPPSPQTAPLLQDAVRLHQAGDLAGAEALYGKVLALAPRDFTATHMLGVIRTQQGRDAEALPLIDAALAIEPGSAEALSNRGHVLRVLGRNAEALASIDAALARDPNALQALFNRADVLTRLERRSEALAAHDRLLALKPGLAGVHNNRANLLRDMRRFDEALASHAKAVALQPRDPDFLYNRGVTRRDVNRPMEALADFDKAISIRPDFPQALYARATTLVDLQRYDEALRSVEQALALAPRFADALYAKANILWELKRPEAALAAHEQVLALEPGNPFAKGGIANAVLHLCDWPRAASLAEDFKTDIPAGRALISPFTLLGYPSGNALQLACARATIAHRIAATPPPLAGKAYAHDRLRLAYLSYDFSEHPVAIQLAELIERHDRARFEVIGVSTGRDDASPMRARLLRAFDQFHDVQAMSDRDVAQLLRKLEVDILVDLGGHTHGARLEILSHRPAPLQVSYLGYPGTTGADFLDYVLADPIVVPLDQQPFYTEKIAHLPVSYMVSDATRKAGSTPSRRQAGLPEQGFVFCSFNKFYKVSAPVFAAWMRLLHAVPGSVFWLKDDGDARAKANLLAAAAKAGVDPARLLFAGRVDGPMHLARHRAAGLFLDSLPYNAHVTAVDALWAGLPLVTCLGDCFAGRVAGSLLTALEMPELVTHSLEEYEALALALARDPALLAATRDKLARNLGATALFDTPRFARHMEAAFLKMQDILKLGQPPRAFAIDAATGALDPA